MTYNEKKTNRTFKSEQHAQMTAALALLKYSTSGYHCSTSFLPKDQSPKHNHAKFEVDIYHDYWVIIEPSEYLTPSKIEERLFEADGYKEAYGCTTFIYEYEY